MNVEEELREHRHSRRTKSASEILRGRPRLPPPPPEFDMSLWQKRKESGKPRSHSTSSVIQTETPRGVVCISRTVQTIESFASLQRLKGSTFLATATRGRIKGNGKEEKKEEGKEVLRKARAQALKVEQECERKVAELEKLQQRASFESQMRIQQLEKELGEVEANRRKEVEKLKDRLNAMQGSYDCTCISV